VVGGLLVGVGVWLASRPASIGTLTFLPGAGEMRFHGPEGMHFLGSDEGVVPGVDEGFTRLLTEEELAPIAPQWTHTLGLVAIGAGLTVLGYVAGWLVARRRRGPDQQVEAPR
jgi:hypothetical protein